MSTCLHGIGQPERLIFKEAQSFSAQSQPQFHLGYFCYTQTREEKAVRSEEWSLADTVLNSA